MISDPVHAFIDYPPVPVPNAASGPLAGLTFGVKDIFDVAGYVTGCGSPEKRAESPPAARSAPVVEMLLAAGARFAGKTHTAELAFSLDGRNEHYGTPINPAAPDRVPGGSSSGSAAAVAAGLVDFALGSDTGGSVRAPSSYCGLFGIRPSHGRLSLKRVWPLAQSFDTPGWFARDGEVFARIGEVLLGKDNVTLPEAPRLLLADELFAQAVPDAEKLLRDVIQRIQPLLGEPQAVTVARDLDALYWASRRIQGREAWLNDGPMIERFGAPLGPGVADRFAYAKAITDADFEKSEGVRKRFRSKLAKLLGSDGVLLLPTVPDIAPLAAAGEDELDDFRNRALRLLCLGGLSGFPQVSVPVARREGAPLGLSLIGPRGSDKSLIALAVRLERAARIRIA